MAGARTVAFGSLVLAAMSLQLATAAAQDAPPRTTILRTVVPSADMEGFGRAVERVVRARADDLGVIASAGTPALELDDIQLVVGCLSESVECYHAIAAQLEVEAVMLPTIERAGEEVLVALLFYDDRDQQMRRVVRRAAAEYTRADLIASIDGILRELFDLPPAPVVDPAARDDEPNDGATASVSTTTRSPGDDRGSAMVEAGPALPIAPILVAGTGLLVVGAGVVLSILAAGSEDAYIEAPTTTPDQVDEALRTLDRAEHEALAANIALGVGAAAVVAGTVWFLLALGDDSDEAPEDAHVSLLPRVRPGVAASWELGLQIGGVL